MTIAEQMKQLAREAKEAAAVMATLPSPVKDDTLRDMADELIRERAFLQRENERDLELAQERGLTAAMIDRLTLTEGRIADMAKGLREVASLPDPVGRVTTMWRRPNGLLVGRMRIPLGVIGIIYESRPNVTADAAALCLKAGNAVILRGGSEALHSNVAIAQLLRGVARKHGLPAGAIQMVPITDRAAVYAILQCEEEIDLIIRGVGKT